MCALQGGYKRQNKTNAVMEKKNKPPLAKGNLAEKMGSTQGSYDVYINEPRANRDG